MSFSSGIGSPEATRLQVQNDRALCVRDTRLIPVLVLAVLC